MNRQAITTRIFLLTMAVLALAASIANATVAVSPIFGNHMVLQRNKSVPVYGTAAVGESVTVTFAGQTKSATADSQGNWQVSLTAMNANTTAQTMTITGTNTISITDVLVGDVWVTSGQSNMEWNLYGCNRQTEDVNTANYPRIRHFYVPPYDLTNPTKSVSSNWNVCSPGTAGGFGAIAFYFARKIQQELGSSIPIGIFQAPRGATAIDPWLAPEGTTDIPVLQPLYTQSVVPWGPFSFFNGTIYPLAPYAITGVLWYQGESMETTNQTADSYFLKEKAIAQGWKRLWGMDDLPFYVVLLAAFNDAPTGTNVAPESGNWTNIRIQQMNVLGIPHGGVASAIDIGDAADIHPKNKLDVGERLALWALKNEYGRSSVVPSGPVLSNVTVSGNKAICSFDYVGAGLMVGSKTAYQPTAEVVGGTLARFSIAGATGSWYDATAVINGSTVELTSASVSTPTKVAYACFNNPAGANLYNKNGLPAAPFYVDNISAKYTVTASAGAGGSISPAGATTYLKRKTALYTITPSAGYYIQSVTVDGVSVGADKTYTFDPLYANHTISATFTSTAPTYTINASSSTGGSITSVGVTNITQGGAKTYTLAPNSGCRIIGLTVDGAPMGTRNSFTFSNVTSNHVITGSFAVIPTPGVGTGLRGDYFSGSNFDTYRITRTDAKIDFSWYQGYPDTSITSDPFSIRWTGSLEPQFTETYTFYLLHDDGAKLWVNNQLIIDKWPAGYGTDMATISLTAGQKVPIKLEYCEKSDLASVKLEWASPSIIREVIPQSQLSPATIVITPSASAGGSISPNGPVVLSSGGSQTFTITPSIGYAIADVKVDGASVGAIGTYTFSNVTTSHTISATFNLLPTYAVSGKVTNQSTGAGIPGATVSFCTTTDVWAIPAFTTTTDASGNYIQSLANGTWYVYAAATGYFKSANQTLTVNGAPMTNVNLSLSAIGRNIPRADLLVGSWVTDSLPASGSIASWTSFLPTGQPFTKNSDTGSPTVQTISGVKWESNIRANGDGFNHSTIANTAIPCSGASIVMAVKPIRNTTGDSWTCCFDVYCYTLSFGIRNNTGNICVWRNGSFFDYPSAVIPDGQTTIMSAIVQPDGKFKIFANGTQIVSETAASTFIQMTPGTVGWQQNINLGRTGASGWSSFNGYIGDTFFYRAALSDTDRQALEADLTSKFGGSGSTSYTIAASAATGGSISPSGNVTVFSGASQTFNITSNSGYAVSGVTVDGAAIGAVSSYTFSNVTANHSISATFTATSPGSYTITASAGTGGSISPAGAVSVTSGANQTFSITANSGYTISGVTVDGSSVGVVSSYTFSNVIANHTISATFSSSSSTYTITASAATGGSISPTGAVTVNAGANQAFTITPNSGYIISGVTVDGTSVGAVGTYTFSNVTANHTISATFLSSTGGVPRTDQLYGSWITDSLPASGVINSWASYLPTGLTFVKMGSATVATIDGVKWESNLRSSMTDGFDLGNFSTWPCNGASFVMVIKPVRIATSDAWTSLFDIGCMGLTVGVRNNTGGLTIFRKGTQYEYTTAPAIIPDGQKTILSCIFQENGSFKIYANGALIVDNTNTTDANLPLNPVVPWYAGAAQSNNWASHINLGRTNGAGWSVFNGYIGDTYIYKVALTDAERLQLETQLANKFINYTLSASAGEGGAISPSGAVSVAPGGSQAFSITPNSGYAISSVTVDGASVGAVSSYTFNNVAANHTISATFKLAVKPIGMNNKSALTDSKAQGKVVKIWGKVKSIYGTISFVISDGYDSTGIKVVQNGVALPLGFDTTKTAIVTGLLTEDATGQPIVTASNVSAF